MIAGLLGLLLGASEAEAFYNLGAFWRRLSFDPTSPSIVVGAPDFDTNEGAIGSYIVPVSAWTDGTRILTADNARHRVLLYNSWPTANRPTPDVAIGQPNLMSYFSNAGGTVSASTTAGPSHAIIAGTRLIVADSGNHRLLVWNTVPTAHGTAANLVLGQPDFTSNLANRGGATAADTLNTPRSIWSDGTALVVADASNNRILIWNTFPTVNGQAADVVLGQSTFTTNTANNGGRGAATLSSPHQLAYGGGTLWVADNGNHRVLGYAGLPTVNGTAATVVLGQTGFTTAATGTSATTFNSPFGVATDGTRLLVGDRLNRRYLLWNAIPTASTTAADLVIGQPDMTTAACAPTAAGFCNGLIGGWQPAPGFYASIASGVFGTRLALTDTGQNRIKLHNSLPTANHAPADLSLSQTNLTDYQWPHQWRADGSSLAQVRSIALCENDTKMAVADYTNNRVLIWNSIPISMNQPADLVLGQPSFTTVLHNAGADATPGATTMASVSGVACGGGRLAVADSQNHRVLLWNSFPTSNQQPADVVLGQPNFTTRTQNNGGVTASSMNFPIGVATDGTRVAVGCTNRRVLIWNTWPAANFQDADLVIGQPNFTSSTANNGGISAATLGGTPTGVTIRNGRLVVADNANHRLLVWSSFPTASFQSADLVLGQPDAVTSTSGTATDKLNGPYQVATDGTRIAVADSSNHRVLIWRAWPTATGQAPDHIVGQNDPVSALRNRTGTTIPSKSGLNGPLGVAVGWGRLLIGDNLSYRLLIWNVGP